jgi:hypothetical protein
MILDDYYFSDSRLVLVPIEHLDPRGVSAAFADAVAVRRGWSPERIALLSDAFALYWTRAADLARRTRTWAPPRLRHIAVVDDPLDVHPHAQLLNTSAWTLYACDLDPARSHPELVAYLFAHGERATQLGEVSLPALHNAAWWFDRSDAECAAFGAAAIASTRPDAAALHALADALPWLRQLGHRDLRPAPPAGHRVIAAAELLVPAAHEAAPPRLVEQCAAAARDAAERYAAAWRRTDLTAVGALVDWIRATEPLVVVCARGGRVVWDPDAPARLGALRAELKRTAGAAVRDLHADLAVLDHHTRRFVASLTDPAALPAVPSDAEQRGYTYLHGERCVLAYDLDEPGIDRRNGPALPFARAMLGARAVHEWAHLAVAAGWVPHAVPTHVYDQRVATLAEQLGAAVAAAPEAVRRVAADDLAALTAAEAAPAGAALARLLLRRMSDFQANLLAARYLDEAERETYVRQNVRALRDEYPPPRLWRLLLRYLYEFQYLRFSAVADRRTFFVRSTWIDADFFARGVLDAATFDRLTDAVAALCDCYAIDAARFVDIAESSASPDYS